MLFSVARVFGHVLFTQEPKINYLIVASTIVSNARSQWEHIVTTWGVERKERKPKTEAESSIVMQVYTTAATSGCLCTSRACHSLFAAAPILADSIFLPTATTSN